MVQPYYRAHGLERDPFPAEITDEMFFTTPDYQHTLNLIKHLVEFSDELILVLGVAGQGKTALFRRLNTQIDKQWCVSSITATAAMQPDQLLLALGTATGVAEVSTGAESQIIGKLLEHCNRRAQQPVFLIDNAHLLSAQCLTLIQELARLKRDDIALKMVLFAEPRFQERLTGQQASASILHKVDIPPLTAGQVPGYIGYRLGCCGAKPEEFFSAADYEKIYRASAGNPAKVGFLARQKLMDPARKPAGLSRPVVAGRRFALVGVAVLLVMVSLGIYLRTKNWRSGEQTTIITLALPGEAAPATATSPAATAGDVLTSAPAMRPSAPRDRPPDAQRYPANPVEVVPPLPDLAPMSPATVAAVTTADIDVVATTPGARAESSAPKGDDWLAKQAPGHYVLQLIGALQHDTVDEFLRNSGLSADQLALLRTHREGKNWYVLVYGIYPDRETARAAIPNLPPRARRERPWPRSVQSLRETLAP